MAFTMYCHFLDIKFLVAFFIGKTPRYAKAQ